VLHDALKEQGVAKSARIISSRAGGYGLSPDLPPARNFDLEVSTRFSHFSQLKAVGGEDAGHCVCPRWGFYCSILDWDNLRADKANVRFANFSVGEVMLDNQRN
jgi:hypothetical protein